MKKYIFIFILSIGYLNSQERENRKDLIFISESQVIKNAIGWSFNNTSGNWISHKNFLSDKVGSSFNNKVTANQNFINLQFRGVKYDSLMYYALIIPKFDYSYKYPSIQVGIYSYKRIDIYVFSDLEYNKINSLKNEIYIGTRMFQSIEGNLKNIRQQDLLDTIQTIIIADINRSEFDKKYSNEFSYIFPIKKIQIKDKVDVRFFLPSFNSDFKESSVRKPKLDFDNQYFELDELEFKKFIIKSGN